MTTQLEGLKTYLHDHFDGNMIELIQYMNYSIEVIHRNVDRTAEPEAVNGVIDGLIRLNGAFIDCLSGPLE